MKRDKIAMQNVLLALRVLRKAPSFSLLVAFILALGIGANTSVFTVVNAALLRPLPYRDSSRLVSVTTLDRSGDDTNSCLSYPHFQLIAGHARGFSGLAAYTNETFSFSNGGDAVQIQAARVSWNFFDLLGVSPIAGRNFTASESKPGGKPVALISNDLWRRRFNANPGVVGQPVTLDSVPYTIIGVLPANFQFGLLGTDTELWIPRIDELTLASAQQIQGGTCYLNGIARLAPGISIEQAQAEMKILDQQYIREFPKMGDADPNRPLNVAPLNTRLVGNFRSILLMLAAAVALVLSIACANTAGLLLTRALKRRREVAIRIAMGAARSQLMIQFLTESVLIALLGGIGGVALSIVSTHALVRAAGQSFPRLNELTHGVDLTVLAFALTLSVATGIVFGLAPALHFSNINVSASLREEGRGTAGAPTRNVLRNLLVALQIALSLVLLVGAGLLIRSFVLLETESPGFNSHQVLTMKLALPPSRYAKPDQMIGFFDELVERVEVLPGVKGAAVSSALPLNVARLTPILVEGQPAVPLPERPIVIVQAFTSGYSRVMQVPLLQGRFFDAHDTADSLPLIVVNEKFARRFFPGQSPIGKHVWIGRRPVPAQIVGVVGNIKNVSLATDAQPEFDMPFAQLPWGRMNLLVRSIGDPKSLVESVRLQIAKLDRDLPVIEVRPLDNLLAEASTQPRLLMTLLTAFAAFAFVLAILGLYSAISYSVAQRTQEMGVRIALGATRSDLLRLVLGYGALIATVGIGVGVASAMLLTKVMEKFVYGIGTTDPITFFVVSALFLFFALLASYLPARRAMRVDVICALREQ